MRIAAIRERAVSLARPVSSAAIGFDEMTASAVAIDIDTGRGTVTGYGFSSVGRYAQSGLVAERFAPRLLAGPDLEEAGGTFDPAGAQETMRALEKPGGDGDRAGAVGVLDMALWDAAAKIADVPLWRLVADRDGTAAVGPVPVYASGGHYHGDGGLAALADEIRGCLDRGYARVKIKCGRDGLDDDRARIDAVLPLVGGRGDRLAVDVNCCCRDGDEAAAMAEAFAPYGLAWIEEPGHPHDFAMLEMLAAGWPTPIATGENLFSWQEARNLLRHGGLRPDRDLLQIDPPLAYGLPEYEAILRLAASGGWPRARMLPHAGHLFAFHLVAGLGLGGHEVAADPGFVIGGLPAGSAVEDGRASLPEGPGIGFEGHPALWAVLGRLAPG